MASRLNSFLSEMIYRAKGIVDLEQLPAKRVVLQEVGKRRYLVDNGSWGAKRQQSEIVMTGTREGIGQKTAIRGS
jgi:G3E family GTPase